MESLISTAKSKLIPWMSLKRLLQKLENSELSLLKHLSLTKESQKKKAGSLTDTLERFTEIELDAKARNKIFHYYKFHAEWESIDVLRKKRPKVKF